MEITNFGKKQFKQIEILTGSGRKTAVLSGNDILSGGKYSFQKFIHDAKSVEHAIPAPVKQAIVQGALTALTAAGRKSKKVKESKPKQGHLVKGSKEAKERMAHLRSLCPSRDL